MSRRSNQKPAFGQRSTSKNHVTSINCGLEPAIWSRDTGQQISCFDRCQLPITWMSFSLYGYGALLGGPSGRRSSAITEGQRTVWHSLQVRSKSVFSNFPGAEWTRPQCFCSDRQNIELRSRGTKFIAEPRRPEGPPSGAPYSYRKEKETHELIFSRLSWPAALLVGAYARRRRRRRRSRARWRPYSKQQVDRDMQPWFTVYFFDIGHPCYDQLTPVKTRYPLTSITCPYRGLKCTAQRSHLLFGSWLLTKCWFSIGSRAHVRFTC